MTPALFGGREDKGTGESLTVVGADEARVVPALQAAARRWLFVTEDGEDLSRLAPDTLALGEAAGERFTPNFVFDVYRAARGPALLVDCKGVVTPAMAKTFVEVVVQELRRAGVTSAMLDDAGAFTGTEDVLAPTS